MAYQVLARKWRPKNFQEMVGQAHVLRALVNALNENRLHHAYLFTGTRGVGKTTIARIISKSLNCEAGVSATPCGQCATCMEIDEGRFVDLIEVDAASRTKVEDTRELLENVQYAPTSGRYKVYLIDEVHMLSTSSFNALLKTLEEPPPHVKFLLATTDPQKLPATVLSRCLQFSLKRMPMEQIVAHHQFILGEEGIDFDEAALKHIARAADGSMRDSLSLLDQAIAFGHGQVRTDDVVAMLGFISKDHIQRILQALAQGDSQGMLAAVAQLAEMSPDFTAVLDELLAVLHQLALAKQLPEALDDTVMDREALQQLAADFSPEDIQLYYQIALVGKRDLPLVPEPRNGLEMVLLRMLAFKPAAYTGSGGGAGKLAASAAPAAAANPAPSGVTASVKTDAATSTATSAASAAPNAAAIGAAASAPAAVDTVATEPEAATQPEQASETKPAEPAAESQSHASPEAIRAHIEAAHAALGGSGKKSRAARRQALIAGSDVPPAAQPAAVANLAETPAAEPIAESVPEPAAPSAAQLTDIDPALADYEQYAASDDSYTAEPLPPASAPAPPSAPKSAPAPAPAPAPDSLPEAEAEASTAAQAKPKEPQPAVPPDSSLPSASWGELISRLDMPPLVMELAQNCALKRRQGNTLELVLSATCTSLLTVSSRERLQEALSVYFGTPQKLLIEPGHPEEFAETPAQKIQREQGERQQYAVDTIMNDPHVKQFQQHFGAQVKQEAIRMVAKP